MLPAYHHGVLARIMVLAVFAMGYNLLFGYVGLLSLGHAMFFSAGLYGAGLTMQHLGWGVPAAFVAGVAAGALLALVIGLLALRTTGVAFMIVTMMFAQVFYLMTLYYGDWTRGDEGFVLPQQARAITLGDRAPRPQRSDDALLDGARPVRRSCSSSRWRSSARAMAACWSPSARTRSARRCSATTPSSTSSSPSSSSGAICAAAGAGYAVLFGYVGSTFASVQYSILPLLWVLLGGAATTLGPLLGTLFMYYVVDITSGYTSAYLLIVGVALILLVLFFPKGMLGTIRDRWMRWLP